MFSGLPYTARPLFRHGELVATRLSARVEGLTLKRILIAQLVAMILVVAMLLVLAPTEVRSALIGAGISVVGNSYAVRRVFVQSGGKSAQGELATLYRAEFGKLFIVGGLCAVAFIALDEIRIAGFLSGLFTGMIAATAAVATQKIQLPDEERKQI